MKKAIALAALASALAVSVPAEARTLAPTMIRFNAVASALVAVAALAIGAVADGLGLRMAAAITAATVVLGLAALAITERRSRTA